MILPKHNRCRSIWLIGMIIFDILDVWSTYLNVIVLNGRELNPIVHSLIEKFGAAAAIVILVPIYKGLMVFSFWLFLRYLPYAIRPTLKIFSSLKKVAPFRVLVRRYLRFVGRFAYLLAYLVLFSRITAVIFNLHGAISYFRMAT